VLYLQGIFLFKAIIHEVFQIVTPRLHQRKKKQLKKRKEKIVGGGNVASTMVLRLVPSLLMFPSLSPSINPNRQRSEQH
jgi:hypothetical protein